MEGSERDEDSSRRDDKKTTDGDDTILSVDDLLEDFERGDDAEHRLEDSTKARLEEEKRSSDELGGQKSSTPHPTKKAHTDAVCEDVGTDKDGGPLLNAERKTEGHNDGALVRKFRPDLSSSSPARKRTFKLSPSERERSRLSEKPQTMTKIDGFHLGSSSDAQYRNQVAQTQQGLHTDDRAAVHESAGQLHEPAGQLHEHVMSVQESNKEALTHTLRNRTRPEEHERLPEVSEIRTAEPSAKPARAERRSTSNNERDGRMGTIFFFIVLPFFFSLLYVLRGVMARCAVMSLTSGQSTAEMTRAYQYLLRQTIPTGRRSGIFFDGRSVVDDPIYRQSVPDSLQKIQFTKTVPRAVDSLPNFLITGDINVNESARSLALLIYEYNGIVAFGLRNNLTIVHRPLVNLHGPERPLAERHKPSGLGDIAEEYLQLGRNGIQLMDLVHSKKTPRDIELPDSDQKAQFYVENHLQNMDSATLAGNRDSVLFVRPSSAGRMPGFGLTADWWREKLANSKLMQLQLSAKFFASDRVNIAVTLPAHSVFQKYALPKRAASWAKGLSTIMKLIRAQEGNKKIGMHFITEEPEVLGSTEFVPMTYWLENITAAIIGCEGQCAVQHTYPYDRPILMLRHILAADVIVNTKSELGHIASILSPSISVSLSHFWAYDGAQNHVDYDENSEKMDENKFTNLWKELHGKT
mmetsp:Transcript_11283/g.34536  ORF Transcript_11283/g.34536 Transcript_11283/m.34536 type:complete len:694 (-) Transcript_11283:104-2185(-)